MNISENRQLGGTATSVTLQIVFALQTAVEGIEVGQVFARWGGGRGRRVSVAGLVQKDLLIGRRLAGTTPLLQLG